MVWLPPKQDFSVIHKKQNFFRLRRQTALCVRKMNEDSGSRKEHHQPEKNSYSSVHRTGAGPVSVLVRSHLRGLARLPNEERLALKESVAELAAIGRNLNQIARASDQGARVSGPTQADLRAILKACEALRLHVRGILKANAVSWQVGHGETHV